MLPAAQADTSVGHFEWLVTRRSANQTSTLRLYALVSENEAKLNRNVDLQAFAQELVAVSFSLWRAVFLGDTTGEDESRLADAQRFLVSLIADNTISYVTDKNSRNWSFRYYLDNAMTRLNQLRAAGLDPATDSELVKRAASDKDEWDIAQAALDHAVERFAERLAGRVSPAPAS